MVTKVRRVIERYGLSGLGDELADRWVGDGYDRESLRSLADRFNKQMLAANMEAAGLTPLEGEVDNTYRLLTDDAVSARMQTQLRRRLERDGLTPESLQSDFVSHQAIHTYLTRDRKIDPPTADQADSDRLEADRETIQRLQSRLEAVAENTVSRLDSTDQLDVGAFSVLVDLQILCADCGDTYEITELFEHGGCDCRNE